MHICPLFKRERCQLAPPGGMKRKLSVTPLKFYKAVAFSLQNRRSGLTRF